jgi:BirA family transcriptional regulator, biotin operon repressor / biotin---[acetyl-CoA-carboxylase] ligase
MSCATDLATFLKQNLHTNVIARQLHCMDVTKSTMDVARRLIKDHATNGTAIISLKQESGRGRMGRSWLSPDGVLATSVILYLSSTQIKLVPAMASVSVYQTIKSMGINASIKWPNDILISGKKVCGILIENIFLPRNRVCSIIGIGVNVNFDITKYPEIEKTATSLSIQLGRKIPLEDVALGVFSAMDELLNYLDDPNRIMNQWVSKMETMGKYVSINTGNTIVEGTAESLSDEGNLILRLANGSTYLAIAGDVTNIREKAN